MRNFTLYRNGKVYLGLVGVTIEQAQAHAAKLGKLFPMNRYTVRAA